MPDRQGDTEQGKTRADETEYTKRDVGETRIWRVLDNWTDKDGWTDR